MQIEASPPRGPEQAIHRSVQRTYPQRQTSHQVVQEEAGTWLITVSGNIAMTSIEAAEVGMSMTASSVTVSIVAVVELFGCDDTVSNSPTVMSQVRSRPSCIQDLHDRLTENPLRTLLPGHPRE
jgi:hypothetical protein